MENQIRQNGLSLAGLKNSAMGFDQAILKPVFIGEEKQEDKGHFAVFNTDKSKVSAIVSDQYNLVQHQHVVNEVATALQNLNIKCDASVSDGGDVIFVDVTFKDSNLYIDRKDMKVGEEFFTGIRIINSYNKTTGILVVPRLMRKVCSNGMIVNVGWVKSINITHTNKLAEDFAQEIPRMIENMVNSSDKFKAMLNDCIADSIEWESLKIIVKTLIKTDKHSEAIWKILTQVKDIKGKYNRWDFYNSITNYTSTNQQLTPLVEQMLQNKAQTVLTTPLAQLMPKKEQGIPA